MQIPYLFFQLGFAFFTLNPFLSFLFVSTFTFSPLSYLFNVYIYIKVLPSPLILPLTLSFFFSLTGTRVTFTSPFSPYFSWIKDSRGLLDPVYENHSWKQVFNPGTAYLCNSVFLLHLVYICMYIYIYSFIYSRKIYIQPREGMGMKNGLEEPMRCQKKKKNEKMK